MKNLAESARKMGPLILALLLAGAALALDFALAKPGASSDLVRFVGRFHPLVVHLPIGFLLLVAFAESLTLFPRLKSRIDPALALLWPALALVSIVAFGLGLLLAHDGGYPAKLVTLHRRLTLAAVLGIGLNMVLWARVERGHLPRSVYRAVLAVALGLLSVGAHFGGSLSRGDDYLFEYAPSFVQRLLHLQPPAQKAPARAPPKAEPSAEPLVYQDVVLPIFRQRCVSCHGPDKAKGELRLDSFAGLKKGGKNGVEVTPGESAQSRLLARMALPISDDEHMPPQEKSQPTPSELELVKWWIDRGANDTMRVRDALVPDGARALLIHSAVASGVTGLDPASPASSAQAVPEPEPTRAAPSVSSARSALRSAGGRAAQRREPRAASALRVGDCAALGEPLWQVPRRRHAKGASARGQPGRLGAGRQERCGRGPGRRAARRRPRTPVLASKRRAAHAPGRGAAAHSRPNRAFEMVGRRGRKERCGDCFRPGRARGERAGSARNAAFGRSK